MSLSRSRGDEPQPQYWSSPTVCSLPLLSDEPQPEALSLSLSLSLSPSPSLSLSLSLSLSRKRIIEFPWALTFTTLGYVRSQLFRIYSAAMCYEPRFDCG
jgi:hypothetical protein